MRIFIYVDKFFLVLGVKNVGYFEIIDGFFGEYIKELFEGEVNIID